MRRGLRRLDVAVLAAIALVGLVQLPLPLTGDQALFVTAARELRHGAVLYRDFWDVKQPGIYWFYLGAGSLFGFDEIGVHVAELVALLGFGVALQRTLRGRFRTPWLTSVAPLLVVGVYYAGATVYDLTQVEALAGFPLYLALHWSVTAGRGSGRGRARRLVLAGLMGGIVVAFKLVYLPVVAVMWLAVLLRERQLERSRAPDPGPPSLVRSVGWLAAGLAVPLAVFASYFGAHHLLGDVWHTYAVITPHTNRLAPAPASRLWHGLARFALVYAMTILLAVAGLVAATRRHAFDLLTTGLVAWLVASVPMFLVQHWYAYNLLMFLTPLTLLALDGFDALWSRRAGATPRALLGIAAAAVVPLVLVLGAKGVKIARYGFGITHGDRVALAEAYEPNYRPAVAFAHALRGPQAAPGAVYVLGNPLDYYVAERGQAIAVNGWSPEQWDRETWDRIARELRAARPPYIVIARDVTPMVRRHAPSVARMVDEQYCRFGGAGDQRWYARRDLGQCG